MSGTTPRRSGPGGGALTKSNACLPSDMMAFQEDVNDQHGIDAALCDAPKPGGPLTTRQPAENLYISDHETHT